VAIRHPAAVAALSSRAPEESTCAASIDLLRRQARLAFGVAGSIHLDGQLLGLKRRLRSSSTRSRQRRANDYLAHEIAHLLLFPREAADHHRRETEGYAVWRRRAIDSDAFPGEAFPPAAR
jgi:hypothetical protein